MWLRGCRSMKIAAWTNWWCGSEGGSHAGCWQPIPRRGLSGRNYLRSSWVSESRKRCCSFSGARKSRGRHSEIRQGRFFSSYFDAELSFQAFIERRSFGRVSVRGVVVAGSMMMRCRWRQHLRGEVSIGDGAVCRATLSWTGRSLVWTIWTAPRADASSAWTGSSASRTYGAPSWTMAPTRTQSTSRAGRTPSRSSRAKRTSSRTHGTSSGTHGTSSRTHWTSSRTKRSSSGT